MKMDGNKDVIGIGRRNREEGRKMERWRKKKGRGKWRGKTEVRKGRSGGMKIGKKWDG